MINCAVIMGRLVADPELRTTTSGKSVTSFCVAVDRNYVRQGEERQTDFINVVAWRQNADFVTRYFHKGSMIAVEGSIQTSSYTDKSGNQRKQVEVVANNVSFCGSKNDSGTGASAVSGGFNEPAPSYASADNSDFEEIVDDDDDLPF